MIESEQIFKVVNDKIDYNKFVELVEEYQEIYNLFVHNKEAFNTFYDEDINFVIYLNKDADLTLENSEENCIFFTINSKINTNNIFTRFLNKQIKKDCFIKNLKNLINKYKNNKLLKIKKDIFKHKHLNLYFIVNNENSLIHLLDDDFFINLVKKDLCFLTSSVKDFILKYKKHYKASYIIKLNCCLQTYNNEVFLNNQNKLVYNDTDTFYFNNEKVKLFDRIRNWKYALPKDIYLILIYGLYFELFNQKELNEITSFLNRTNQLYIYENEDPLSDFNPAFVYSLLIKNNINFTFKNIKYYDNQLVRNNEHIYFHIKKHKLKYLSYLIDDLMNSDGILIHREELYSDITNNIIKHIDFLSSKCNIDKNSLLNKIDNLRLQEY